MSPRSRGTGVTASRPALVVLVALALVAAPAAAGERSDTENLDPGEFASIPVDFQDGAAMDVDYDIQVQSGPNMDVMVMDNANFQRYSDGNSFEYVSSWSVLDTGSAEQQFTLEEHGTWHIVLDHTNDPDNGASPSTVDPQSVTVGWTVATQVNVERSVEEGFAGIPAPGAAAALASLLAAGLAFRRPL